ncbi:MAG: acyl-CoA dehydrogenase family protein, partial [Candidatus Limnocylindria bacterium]
MDAELPEELRLLRTSVRRFVEERLEPRAQDIEDREDIGRDVIEEMAGAGLFGVAFPERYGGMELGMLGYCVAVEELARANAALWNVVGGSAGLCGTAILIGGPEEVRQRYLPHLASARLIGAYALSEPNAGSDAGSLRTVARRDGDRYVLDGAKTFITNAPIADVFVVFATVDRAAGSRGITAFAVERSTPGLEVGPDDAKMGLHGSRTAQVFLHEASVDAAARIGEEGRGFAVALGTLDHGRLGLAAHAVGSAQRLLEAGVAHARSRSQFGRPIGSNQAIQWPLADAATELHAARLMLYDAAWRLDRGERVSDRAAMTKLFATELLGRVADAIVQIHGGMGYASEYDVERYWRDARV